MTTSKKSNAPGTTAMELYVDQEDHFRVRVHIDKEVDAAVALAFEEGGAPTPGKALRWAGKILDEVLSGAMYDSITMDDEEIIEMPPSAGGGAKTVEDVVEKITGTKRSEDR